MQLSLGRVQPGFSAWWRGMPVAGPQPAAGLEPALLHRLDGSSVLAGPDRSVELLPGGLTNRNLKVETPSGVYVARLAGTNSELLAIDRDAEYRNSLAAAALGVAPEV